MSFLIWFFVTFQEQDISLMLSIYKPTSFTMDHAIM